MQIWTKIRRCFFRAVALPALILGLVGVVYALTPTDPYFANQWYLKAKSSAHYGANLPGAWDITSGDPYLNIAVIDTGKVPHEELDGRYVGGYDFVSNPLWSGDGDGQDSDPTDTGTTCGFEDIYHGNAMAGIIGSASNNGIGIAGINWESMLVPIRAFGACGGSGWTFEELGDDFQHSITWAAGGGIGHPNGTNPNPAQVINISFETTPLTCETSYPGDFQSGIKSAISTATGRGSVVVVGAGNDGLNSGAPTFPPTYLGVPASCGQSVYGLDMIVVTATDYNGNIRNYANMGPEVDIAAPATGIWTTENGGYYTGIDGGTSSATAIVSGVVSLMLSVNSGLSPAQVEEKLKATATPFPLGSLCDGSSGCGAGIVDAEAAVIAVSTPPTANAGPDQIVPSGGSVALDATGSADDPFGAIVQYEWIQMSGPSVTLSDPFSPVPVFTAPQAPATLVFEVSATDDLGLQGTDTITVDVTDYVIWTDIVGMVPVTGGLQKTAADGWGNAGAASVQVIPDDGGIEISPDSFAYWDLDNFAIGLSGVNINNSWDTIENAIQLDSTIGINCTTFICRPVAHFMAQIFESGTGVGAAKEFYPGDKFRIDRTGGIVTYTHIASDGQETLLYTSSTSSTGNLIVDMAANSNGVVVNTPIYYWTGPGG